MFLKQNMCCIQICTIYNYFCCVFSIPVLFNILKHTQERQENICHTLGLLLQGGTSQSHMTLSGTLILFLQCWCLYDCEKPKSKSQLNSDEFAHPQIT